MCAGMYFGGGDYRHIVGADRRISGIFCRQAYGRVILRILIEEYGRLMLTVLCCLFLAGVVFSGFMERWHDYGGIRDSVKTNFRSNEEKRTAPVIWAEDFKAVRGEKINFSEFISAIDFDRRDITGEMEIAMKTGDTGAESEMKYKNIVSGFDGAVWEEQGIFRFLLKVKSPVTGKTARGELIVLVDYPGNN